ncbi:PQQ-binding-like beta-propeller repeat protein [Kribbella sp. CA-253562]|uniref:outer membrane protein assembly factor BamB family protein n=1 Tax=Kribbella sp. CA-253562 TaxID=3239942 RepID=UPI003D9121F7
MTWVTGLRERWNDLLPGAAALADDLVARYRADDRRAYREQYLQGVLDALGVLDQLSTDPTAVYLAAWFHRAVHEPGGRPAADAEASAVLAEQELPSYGVTSTRTAEVARLVRLTGTPAPPDAGPNADVLLDAVNATLAGPDYAVHAAELRRDGDDRETTVKQRHAAVRELLDGPIYRTQLGRDRYAAAARANLARELALLDAEIPAPWRGWRRAALIGVAAVSPLVAAFASFAATDAPWQSSIRAESAWRPGLLCLLALVAAPLLFVGARRSDRWARIGTGLVTVAAAAGLVVAIVLIPDHTASNGPGERVPLVVASLVLLLLGGLAAFVSASLTGPLPAPNRGQVLAGVTAAALVVAATVFVAAPVGREYVLSANERVTGTTAPEAAALRSELTGRIAWESPASSLRAEAVGLPTRYGIAIARQTGSVELLAPGTGDVLWRYSRADSDDRPELSVTGGGRFVLAEFDDVGYLLLDAATGHRAAAWPHGTRDHTLENADPLLTGEQVSKGSDKLRGVNDDGEARWTFEPGRCTSITATATADTVLTFLNRSCGDATDEMTALDLETGKQLWSRPADWVGDSEVTVDDLVIGVEARSGSRGTLVALEARSGEVAWRWPLPAAWSCNSKVVAAGSQVVLLNCPSAASRSTAVVATVVDARTGELAWQQTVPGFIGKDVAITTDARVVWLQDTGRACELMVLGQTGQRRVTLPEGVVCRRGVHAAGNQLLVSGENAVIALR